MKRATIPDTKNAGGYLMAYLTSYISLLIAPSLNAFPMSKLYKMKKMGGTPMGRGRGRRGDRLSVFVIN